MKFSADTTSIIYLLILSPKKNSAHTYKNASTVKRNLTFSPKKNNNKNPKIEVGIVEKK